MFVGPCSCWASPARFAVPSLWRSTSVTWKKYEDGLRITIRNSKTDQEGRGQVIAFAAVVLAARSRPSRHGWQRPGSRKVRSFDRWPRAVSWASQARGEVGLDTTKAYSDRVGLDAATVGAHSLRSGFLISAARRGASVFKMRDVSRHKGMDVLQA